MDGMEGLGHQRELPSERALRGDTVPWAPTEPLRAQVIPSPEGALIGSSLLLQLNRPHCPPT